METTEIRAAAHTSGGIRATIREQRPNLFMLMLL